MKWKFVFPKDCRIEGGDPLTEFVLRETSGKDTAQARMRATAKGEKDTGFMVELTRLAVVSVNDTPVQDPYLEMDKWNTKAQSLLFEAMAKVNAPSEEESGLFLGTAQPV